MPDLITAIESAALVRFAGAGLDHLGKVAWERVQQLGTKAVGMLTAVGREAQPVEPKLLLPLAQAAALEPDSTLAEKWAALLANAADPTQQVQVQPSFIEVLRQFTPTDAAVLTRIYRDVRPRDQDLLYYELQRIITQRMAAALELTEKQFALSIDVLLRLRLCAPPTPRKDDLNGLGGTAAASRQVCPTVFGLEFLQAVSPPAT